MLFLARLVLTRALSLLPQLMSSISLPTTKRQTAISQHALHIIKKVVSQEISQAFTLASPPWLLEQLAVCDYLDDSISTS